MRQEFLAIVLYSRSFDRVDNNSKSSRCIEKFQHYLGNLPIEEYCDIIEKIELAASEGLEYISFGVNLNIITEKLLKRHGFNVYNWYGGEVSWRKTCWQKIKTLLTFWSFI